MSSICSRSRAKSTQVTGQTGACTTPISVVCLWFHQGGCGELADPTIGAFVMHWHDEGEARGKDVTSPNKKMTCFEIQMRSSWSGNRRDKGSVSSSYPYIMGHMSFQTMFTRSRPKQWRKHRPVAEHGGKCLASTSSPLQRGSLISSSSAGGFSSETSELHTLMRTVWRAGWETEVPIERERGELCSDWLPGLSVRRLSPPAAAPCVPSDAALLTVLISPSTMFQLSACCTAPNHTPTAAPNPLDWF